MIKTTIFSSFLLATTPIHLSARTPLLDTPAKLINTLPLEQNARPEYVPNSAQIVFGTIIIFTVQWDSHGKQRILAGCNEYSYGLPDISDEMYTAEPNSEMFDLITQACGDVQWI